MIIRPMTTEDAAWAASLMEQRRIEDEQYAPVFWRPASNIVSFHAQFLEAQIADPDVIALRTTTGFAIATRSESHFYVDDFAVENSDWATTGAALLRATWDDASRRGGEYLRVVTAKLDNPKAALLTTHDLELSLQWWVRPIRPVPPTSVAGFSDEFEIQETNAPPVYDPGGAVGILTHFTSAAIDNAIRSAADRDLVLLVAPTPADDVRERALSETGFEIASQFYVGKP